jgi:hypothetical protein
MSNTSGVPADPLRVVRKSTAPSALNIVGSGPEHWLLLRQAHGADHESAKPGYLPVHEID